MRWKELFKKPRIVILILILIFFLWQIYPNPWNEGVAIRSVAEGKPAGLAGIKNPEPKSAPMSREVITAINNRPVRSLEDYHQITEGLKANVTVSIKTNKRTYYLKPEQKYREIRLNETELKNVTKEVFNETLNKTINTTETIEFNKTRKEYLEGVELGLRVYEAPKTNIRKGLDLQGGTRVVLLPEISEEQKDREEELMALTIQNLERRLNVYGLADISVRRANDLSGNNYIVVEIPGVNEEEVKELLSQQGKFEARIANQTVFIGGKDITYVCRTPSCSGIDPQQGCGQTAEGGYACRFYFAITITPEAAGKQAAATKNLEIITEEGEQFLSQKIDFYLDDKLVDSLRIGAELKGNPSTNIQISGGGGGENLQDARRDSLENMKQLQTIIETGSLPIQLKIVRTDSISPTLGTEFVKNSLLLGVIALIAVTLVILGVYRKIKISLLIFLMLLIELVMIMGMASLIGWNIDLAAIAGILIAIGTGVDHLIVIIDETVRKGNYSYNWKEKVKKALFIIMAAYFTTVAAMVPLLMAGAGLLQGFALTTILGVTIGVFITRPAFATIMEFLVKEE